jgi:hypothetical protein
MGDGAEVRIGVHAEDSPSVFRAHFMYHIESDACLLGPRLIDPFCLRCPAGFVMPGALKSQHREAEEDWGRDQ